MDKMVGMVAEYQKTASEEMYRLWLEYEQHESDESIVVHDLDKYEMILQAFEYENRHNVDLQQFFDSTKDYFRTDIVKQWQADVLSKRGKR